MSNEEDATSLNVANDLMVRLTGYDGALVFLRASEIASCQSMQTRQNVPGGALASWTLVTLKSGHSVQVVQLPGEVVARMRGQ